jgi:hypothetical protein
LLLFGYRDSIKERKKKKKDEITTEDYTIKKKARGMMSTRMSLSPFR